MGDTLLQGKAVCPPATLTAGLHAGNGGRGHRSWGSEWSPGLGRLVPKEKRRAVKWPLERLQISSSGSDFPQDLHDPPTLQDPSSLPTSPPFASGLENPVQLAVSVVSEQAGQHVRPPLLTGSPERHRNAGNLKSQRLCPTVGPAALRTHYVTRQVPPASACSSEVWGTGDEPSVSHETPDKCVSLSRTALRTEGAISGPKLYRPL